MREILFRGKLDNGEWVEGNFYESGISGAYILKNVTRKTINARTGEIVMRDEPMPFEVDPSTVGQYTGLKDKNGKRIFEGDIIRWIDWKGDEQEGLVVWDTEWGRFSAFIDGAQSEGVNLYLGPDVEVIGNIHDNPELLEGDKGK